MRNHIDPFLGTLKAEGLQLDVDDATCRELKRCRHHCDGRPHIQHRKWVTHNPMEDAEPPAAPPPSPKPPTARQAALIINAAWRDPDWGTLVWLAMTTGARRGELCALRWTDIDFAPGEETVWISRAIKAGGCGWTPASMR